MNISRSIDYLLENGGNLLRYRLHRDVLHDLTPVEEENHLEGLRQSDDYKLLLSHIHENGYIGRGMHSWENSRLHTWTMENRLHAISPIQVSRRHSVCLQLCNGPAQR